MELRKLRQSRAGVCSGSIALSRRIRFDFHPTRQVVERCHHQRSLGPLRLWCIEPWFSGGPKADRVHSRGYGSSDKSRLSITAADLGFTQKILRFAQDFGSGLPLRSRPLIASTSLTPAKRLNAARIPQRLPQHRDRRESEERR